MDKLEFWFVVVCVMFLVFIYGSLALQVCSILFRRPKTTLQEIIKGEITLNVLSDWMANIAIRFLGLIALLLLLAVMGCFISAPLRMLGII